MKKILFFPSILFGCLIACQAEPGDPDIRAAALLIGADNAANRSQSISDLSASAQSGATGAVAAATVAGSGLNTALRWPGRRESPFQLALREALEQEGIALPDFALPVLTGPSVLPTAFACNGAPSNNCSLGSAGPQYLLNGTESCSLGGTVTATNVPVSLDSQSGLRVYRVNGGDFDYANCDLLNVDYADFPNFKVQRLNGKNQMFGQMISSIAQSPSTFAGFFFSNTRVLAAPEHHFNVNGNVVAMDVSSNSTMSFNMLFDPATQQPINGIVSGTIHLTGTIAGEAVNLNLSFVKNLAEQ